MDQISTKVKKWVNSLGIILPKNIVDSEKIKEGLEVNITIQSRNKMTVRGLFQFTQKNRLPKLKKDTAQLMEEMDRELWPD